MNQPSCGNKRILAHPKHAANRFDFPGQVVGKSTWTGSDGQPVTVYYDPSLGSAGLAIAQNIVPRIDALMAYCDTVFGIRGLGGNVIIAAVNGATDGTGGAYHYGCGFGAQGGDWYEDVAIGNPDLTFGLVMAEVSESYMGLQNKGWNCGGSGGEGLSRYLAEIVSGGPGGALSGFVSGPSWDGTDWISRDQGTDQDYPSIGCAVLYLWWLTKLGYSPAQIVQAGELNGTLSTNYEALTGKSSSQAFADFKSAMPAPGTFSGDNPLNAPVPAYPPVGPVPPPPTPPPPLTVYYTTTFPRAIPKGSPVFIRPFLAPVAIPAGKYITIAAPHAVPQDIYEGTVEE